MNVDIVFTENAPQIECVLVALRIHIGSPTLIEEVEEKVMEKIKIYLLYGQHRRFSLTSHEKRVKVFHLSYSNDSWYLWEATLAVLIKMGGNYTGDLPERAWKPWQDTSEFDDVLNLFNSWRGAKFSDNLPSQNAILTKFQSHTGLFDIEWNESKTQFMHPLISENLFDLAISTFPLPSLSEVSVGVFSNTNPKPQDWYFVEAFLATLRDLGGECGHQLPSRAWKKWEEAKDFYH